MTKLSCEIEGKTTKREEDLLVSVDVSFSYNRFPKYKLGPTNQIIDEFEQNKKCPKLKDIVKRETKLLSDQHNRLSVRDLASKFDKNLASAVKMTEEAKIKEIPSLEGHVVLKKLRDSLESLRVRMVGKHKGDVEKAIAMVEALAVKLTQKEGELIQEKFEVKKLANFLKQASEDAKKLVGQERSFACAEIESARAVVQRFGEALDEEERISQNGNYQNPDVERLVEEVQSARRIKLLHEPVKVMTMEHELRALKNQIRDKSLFSIKLQKELAVKKRAEESKTCIYGFNGAESLGSCLQLRPRKLDAPPLSKCSIQWYRASPEGNLREIITGADKPIYAPEPLDVGSLLEAEITSVNGKVTVKSIGAIANDEGFETYSDTLLRKSSTEFHVVISKINGEENSSSSVHVFNVGKTRIKLCRGWITKVREIYSTSMKLNGVRTDCDAATAAKTLIWHPKRGVSYNLVFGTEKERNAAIVLGRKYAEDCNVTIGDR